MGLISATSRLVSLARSGALLAARKVFDEMPERDEVAWNAMLVAYSRAGESHAALSLFSSMRLSGLRPDAFSITALVAGVTDMTDAWSGMALHALVVRSGFCASLPVCNSLVDMYGKSSCPWDARRVFDEMEEKNEVSWCSLLYGLVNSERFQDARRLFDGMPVQNVVAWNIMIMGHARDGGVEVSMALFKRMRSSGLDGDCTTFASLLNACSELQDPVFGRMIHGVVIRRGLNAFIEVSNSTLSFYARSGDDGDAAKVFVTMSTRSRVSWNAIIDASMRSGDVDGSITLFQSSPEKNIVSWTTMIGGLARNGQGEQALIFFHAMTRAHLRPDDYALGAALHACAIFAVLETGRMIHALALLSGFSTYVYVANGLMNMYAKCGDIKCAQRVFDEMPNRDIVSWNAMLFGHGLHGMATQALKVFDEMLRRRIAIDKLTFIGLLMACSHAGLVEKGKALFERMETVHGVVPEEEHKDCLKDIVRRTGWEISAEEMEAEKEEGYVMLSNWYCESGRWREAEEVRRVMAERGMKKEPGCSWIEVKGRVFVFVAGIQAICRAGRVREMIWWLDAEMKNPVY